MLHPVAPADPVSGKPAIARRVIAGTVRDGVVWAGYDMVNPVKLRGGRVPG